MEITGVHQIRTAIAWLAAVWLTVGVVLLATRWTGRQKSVGLVFAYFLNLWLIHWGGAAIYLAPWYQNNDPGTVKLGFAQSTYAVLAFAIGSVILAPLLRPAPVESPRRTSWIPDRRLPLMYMLIGCTSYAVLYPFLRSFPTASSLVAAAWSLVVVGLCLACWRAWRKGRSREFAVWLTAALALPFVTLVSQGFLGYGAAALLTVLTFVGGFYRPRWKVLVAGMVVFYAGLSVYVGYMADRRAIRAVIWGGRSLDDRLSQLWTSFSDITWFNPLDPVHLWWIDYRLNQNYLVGMAVQNLQAGITAYARGDTLWDALISLVPRALWPGKSVVAGSGNLVSHFTGLTFMPGTSVGIGQVMELYVNFGWISLLVGFAVMGIILTFVDGAAARSLARGDWQMFALWFLLGMSLLQVGGSLVEVTSSAGAAVVTAALVNRGLLPGYRGRRIVPLWGRLRPAQQPGAP